MPFSTPCFPPRRLLSGTTQLGKVDSVDLWHVDELLLHELKDGKFS